MKYKFIKKKKISILLYQLDNIEEINLLNKLNNTKVIFYLHSSTFDWIYANYTIFKYIYKAYSNSRYIISIVPLENDYLFEKWGLNSILMNNFITYEYNLTIPSDLTSNNILMIGRGNAKKKRFQIAIKSMEYIAQEIPKSQLKIISNLTGINLHINLIKNLNLENYVQFIGYNSNPEILFKNISLNLFPSISEAFPMVLCETKIYGIPSILIGLDYTAISKGGTIIIFDDTDESLAKEIIKIITNYNYKKYLGINARESMRKFNNNLLSKKWIKLILSIYKGNSYYNKLREEDDKMDISFSINILYNQIKLLKMRNEKFINISINNYTNLSYLVNYI